MYRLTTTGYGNYSDYQQETIEDVVGMLPDQANVMIRVDFRGLPRSPSHLARFYEKYDQAHRYIRSRGGFAFQDTILDLQGKIYIPAYLPLKAPVRRFPGMMR